MDFEPLVCENATELKADFRFELVVVYCFLRFIGCQRVTYGGMKNDDYAFVQGDVKADQEKTHGGRVLREEIVLWKSSTMIKIIW